MHDGTLTVRDGTIMLLILPWNSSAINGCLLLFGILKHSIIASYACRSGGKYFPIISQSIQPSRPIKFLVLNHSLSENKAAHLLAVLKEHAFCKQSATILPSFSSTSNPSITIKMEKESAALVLLDIIYRTSGLL
jgi:hypothetical protein